MTRLRFLSGMLGAGGWQAVAPHDVGAGLSGQRKPRNNECPVCGTMAKGLKAEMCFGMKSKMDDPKTWFKCADEEVVRCSFCNCAFWVDTE